ncbi:putative serine/threonine protein kinase [Trypanosoma rangeli]|uniref:non-specific serine/threonine protein kinase n=1 Tax=Trypanosoma rangeli TaxID=5698 RepID=A0A3R7LTD9_TRYRA|nr:putative serine/threonine protein kinase [Trypanosoma rangeli]RNF02958.1 putative serine/threonine protein kinase [Trypanosoma rangeli]|eukprot:RNF02958.1 putative serine/threonine protein kinase [Trypanosoma rangeli]
MPADSSAVFTVTPAEKALFSAGLSFARTKKVPTPRQERVDSSGNSGSISHRCIPAAECHEADVTSNAYTSFESSVDSTNGRGTQERHRIRPLCSFLELYRIRACLGHGSYSVVFEVVNRKTKERKAAKFLVSTDKLLAGRKSGNEASDGAAKGKTAVGGGRRISCNTNTALRALSESLVKEVAVSFMADHPNLVHTTEVFVEDVEDLRRRVRRYNPQLLIESSASSSASAKRRVKQEPVLVLTQNNTVPTRRSTFYDSASLRNNATGGVPEQRQGVLPSVTVSSVVAESTTSDTNRSAIANAKRQLQEGKVQCILVMELLSGQELFTIVSRGPINEARAASYMMDLLLALQHLHSKQIVHRDVKVENIVVDPQGKARLIDYGFCEGFHWPRKTAAGSGADAQTRGDDRTLTEFCGSCHYIAPEVIRTSIMQSRLSSTSSGPKAPTSCAGMKLPPIFTATDRRMGGSATTPNTVAENERNRLEVQSAASIHTLRRLLSTGNVGYGTPVDLWSAGVVMFVLLHSNFPFHDTSRSKLLKLISSGKQPVRPSPLLSNDAKDLLRQLLTHDDRRRLTAAQAVEHAWFKQLLRKEDIKRAGSV